MTIRLKKAIQTIKTLLLFIIGISIISACDDDDNVTPVDTEVAYVSIYQASPDAPALRIVVDNRQVNNNPFIYGQNTGYLRFYTGDRDLQFGPFDAQNVVTDTTATFENNMAYSVFLTDEYPDVQPLILNDNAEAPEDGNAMIRFLQLSPDAAAVNLSSDSETLFEDQDYLKKSDFREVSADRYDLKVTSADTNEEILDIPDVNLQSGGYYTVVVRGYANPPAGNSHELSADVLIN